MCGCTPCQRGMLRDLRKAIASAVGLHAGVPPLVANAVASDVATAVGLAGFLIVRVYPTESKP